MPALLSSSATSQADKYSLFEPQFPITKQSANAVIADSTANWSSLYSLSPASNNNEASSYEAMMSNKKSGNNVSAPKKKALAGKKSLDMCTETLGCETGAVYTADDYKRDDLSLKRSGRSAFFEAEERKRKEMMVEKRIRMAESMADFPPPISTISGEGRLHLVGKRSQGRLVMFSIKPPVLHAEKTDGCLRLRMVSTCNNGNAVAGAAGSSAKAEVKKEDVKQEDQNGVFDLAGEKTEMKGMGVFKEVNAGKEMEQVAKYAMIGVGGRCKEEEEGKMSRGISRRDKWEAERAFWVATS